MLFVTERINEEDDDLAFVVQWIQEFEAQGFNVEVICLKKGVYTKSFPVHSLGKEKGVGKIRELLEFYRLIFSLKYDRVFIHLSPFWGALGSPLWFFKRMPVYLWYTHYKMSLSLRITALLARRMFAATPQSLPHYNGNPKKTIVNHGVDVDFWKGDTAMLQKEIEPYAMVSIHRLSRSKRIELAIKALTLLPPQYTLTVYGRALDPEYFSELQTLVATEKLESRVFFKGPVPMPELREVYPRYRLMINMAYETIDKTMLEGMLYGIFPVTTKENMKAIGLEGAPSVDTPDAIANFILSEDWRRYTREGLRAHVVQEHSLTALIQKMSAYITKGT